ncbi:MAG TPA: recombinase family protein [Mycobacteriales bacterium]|nr:recombinase family protein [Mycobacteriales bacterium]
MPDPTNPNLTWPDPDQPDEQDRHWWWRFRLALADRLAPGSQRWVQADAVRRYQQQMVDRAAAATTELVRGGWWLGPAPYGYRLTRAPGGRHRLAVDDWRAPTVPLVFAWYVHAQLTPARIVRHLTTHPDRHPAPLDPHSGQPRPWTPRIVRGVLTNPAYLGHTVRRRTSDGRAQPPQAWLWSDQPGHAPLVDTGLFWAAYLQLHSDHAVGLAELRTLRDEAQRAAGTGA